MGRIFQQYALDGYFALVHAPDWFLVGATFVAGLLCARYYLRYRNLHPLGLVHGLLGTILIVSVPDSVSQHFYIGPGVNRWQQTRRATAAAPGPHERVLP